MSRVWRPSPGPLKILSCHTTIGGRRRTLKSECTWYCLIRSYIVRLSFLTIPQPDEPLQGTENQRDDSGLKTQLENIVNDDYLNFGCNEILTMDGFRSFSENIKWGLIVVGAGGLALILIVYHER